MYIVVNLGKYFILLDILLNYFSKIDDKTIIAGSSGTNEVKLFDT